FNKQGKHKTYREVWYAHDTEVFYRKWFASYFGLMFGNYERLAGLLNNSDGVLTPPQYHWSKWRIFAPQFLQLWFNRVTLKKDRERIIKTQLCRFVNRRWLD